MIYINCLLPALFLAISPVNSVKTLVNRLDPTSISEALAFYTLYPGTEEGKMALKRASHLLTGSQEHAVDLLIPHLNGGGMLSPEAKTLIDRLASHLPNRQLKGYRAKSEAEVLALPPHEIDLGRALLLSQLEGQEDLQEQVDRYCALLDVMALHILAELPKDATIKDKIRAMNCFIFEKMQFRFPPHSIYAKEIDLFTFLPSVMDNHLGVCLGVSALYLAVAQRIGLPLEAMTPPGHIYLRAQDEGKEINIETTARGIALPTEGYLNVNTKHIPTHTIKEVVGMTHQNQASLYLQHKRYAEAVQSYQKARLYMQDDPLIKQLLGFCLLFSGQKEGRQLLKETSSFAHVIAQETMVDDYLAGNVDQEGIEAIFMSVDETRESILKKQKVLLSTLERFPLFREGLEHLAVTWLQLNRPKEALEVLQKYHAIDPTNPTIEYYLAVIYGERQDYERSWHYLKQAEALTSAHNFHPKALKDVRKELIAICPEYTHSCH